MSVYIPIYKRILYDSHELSIQQHSTITTPSVTITEQGNGEAGSLVPFDRQTKSAGPLSSKAQPEKVRPRNLTSAPVVSVGKKGACQIERLKEREQHLHQSRTLKRTSNIIAHRQDQGYYIAGAGVPLKNRYDIEEEELIRLCMLAHSRAEKSTRTNSRNTSAAARRKFSPSPSPSGQSPSPVPTGIHENRTNEEREKRKELQRQKEREKQKRKEEKERFEKEMEERYKPNKPVQKSLIFITESHGKDGQRTFLTDGDFMEDNGTGATAAAVYSFVNDKQREAFTSIFNEMDKNQDGKVDMNELKKYLSSLVSKDNLKYLLQVFDLNKDHTIDVREFVTICALNDKLCGTRTENEMASLGLDLERLSQHITIYKELFHVVDEDCDGRVQANEVLLLVLTALEGARRKNSTDTRNTQENTKEDATPGDSTQEENTNESSTQEEGTKDNSTQDDSTQDDSTQDDSTQDNVRGNKTHKEERNTGGKREIDEDEIKQVLDSIEKDENGFIDFVSFLSYIPFFTQLLKVIMDSPLSISNLEKTRDKVLRKLSKNTSRTP